MSQRNLYQVRKEVVNNFFKTKDKSAIVVLHTDECEEYLSIVGKLLDTCESEVIKRYFNIINRELSVIPSLVDNYLRTVKPNDFAVIDSYKEFHGELIQRLECSISKLERDL